jgi:hypothetical protein
LNDLRDRARKELQLTKIEQLIWKARAESNELSFSELDMDNKIVGVRELVLFATVSYGFPALNQDHLLDILEQGIISQIGRFGFKNLNLPELMLALQLNMKTDLNIPDGIEIEEVNPTGSFFNVNFLSKVLKNYMVIRNLLDKKIKNMIDGNESK